ncbi:hypothetical protein [Pseudoduganella albidiflava]|uniref:Uncharacterized protein n=1 Tax=Pseudoduganella albidiflava TaxID=321983 RepID=A0A411WYE8_9BURK|nr:hypothetical protein [Pseudoduganella albidiflava]QBI01721.1 hypothetical protein EYF70_13335 [Pseudoduganella albidiflava]GGY40194.1 hypothetical protein GCM10007387_22970 [Pseudoduganella albidiflava]
MPMAFPAGAVECAEGDFIVHEQAGMQWHVYRVDDIVAMQRLLACATAPVSLVPESILLDSVTPAYHGEVHLLLTAFDPVFPDPAAARHAILQGTLAERVHGLLRNARDFPKDACEVIKAREA